MRKLLRGGTVVSGQECKKSDILIEDGIIIKVAEHIAAEEIGEAGELVEVTGKLLFPGFIDAHTHMDLAVAGTVTADNFSTGTKAAVSGGTTLLIDFATQYKMESLHQALENWHHKADACSSCDYAFHLAISDWKEPISEELKDIIAEGVTSFKLYMTYDDMVLDDKELYQVLKRLKVLGGIAGVHCENKGIIEARIAEEKAAGNLTALAHPFTRPAEAEAEAISRLLKIAALVDTPIIIVHLSSAAGFREVQYARERGQCVILETCPQYLLLDETCYALENGEALKYVIAPPLRKKEDQEVLWSALQKNQIQTLSTDHCSFTLAQKAMGKADFTKIPGGMPGVETRPVLFYQYGVLQHHLSLQQMCRLLTENPAKLYGVYPQKGCIAPGSDADIVVWDPDCEWVLSVANQVAHVDYSPFEGQRVHGKAEQVYLHGELVARDGAVLVENSGRYVTRGRGQLDSFK
ncbi:MAG: dihydropyrimidinase [Lachnospiraceae bacterium]